MSGRASAPEPAREAAPLRVGAHDDAHEREAEAVAERVVRGEAAGVRGVSGAGALQRCACGGTTGGECAACRRRRLQRSAVAAGPSVAPPSVHATLARAGTPLGGVTRARMERHFGTDLGHVRVHADAAAAESAAAVAARAYTVGHDVVFGRGEYLPETAGGLRLLAHELAHVVQQGGQLRRAPLSGEYQTRDGMRVAGPDEDALELELAQAELNVELDFWRRKPAIDAGTIDDSVLANPHVRRYLSGLTSPEIGTLLGKIRAHAAASPGVTVSALVDFLEARLAIATPMPADAVVTRDPIAATVTGYTLTIGGITVRVAEDQYGAAANDTGLTTTFGRAFGWAYNGAGIVTALNNTEGPTPVPINPSSFEVIITTRFAQPADGPSGYGRGTTEEDKRFGTTELRSHEGAHGTDFLDEMRALAPPAIDFSKGVVGQVTHRQLLALQAWLRDVQRTSCERTDQVGFTQDAWLQTEEGKAQTAIKSCRGTAP